MEPTKTTTLSTSSQKGEIVLYQPDESIRLEVRLEDETVWLTQAQMAELFDVKEHIDNRFYSLESRVEDHEQKIDFLINKEQPVTEQLFSTGCVWDAYTFVSNLVRSASKRIILIDSFVDERTLLILDKRADGVKCDIHTRFNSKLQLDLQKHNQQCNRIIIVQLPQAVHDRYLIIDDEVWLLGASVKDMGRGLCTIIKLGFSPEEILKRI